MRSPAAGRHWPGPLLLAFGDSHGRPAQRVRAQDARVPPAPCRPCSPCHLRERPPGGTAPEVWGLPRTRTHIRPLLTCRPPRRHPTSPRCVPAAWGPGWLVPCRGGVTPSTPCVPPPPVQGHAHRHLCPRPAQSHTVLRASERVKVRWAAGLSRRAGGSGMGCVDVGCVRVRFSWGRGRRRPGPTGEATSLPVLFPGLSCGCVTASCEWDLHSLSACELECFCTCILYTTEDTHVLPFFLLGCLCLMICGSTLHCLCQRHARAHVCTWMCAHHKYLLRKG